jgi:spermidine/putrescine-binding protein
MNKPVLRALATVAVAALSTFGPTGTADARKPVDEIVFLTWADYLDPEIVTEFEQEHDIKVKFRYFESDDARDENLVSENGQGFDLATVNGLMLDTYAKRNWLAPMEALSIPNLEHIEDRWRTAFPGSDRYAVPYFWGTLGIGYRKDLLPEGISSWKDFFAPRSSCAAASACSRAAATWWGWRSSPSATRPTPRTARPSARPPACCGRKGRSCALTSTCP